jgi:hypothetical protein
MPRVEIHEADFRALVGGKVLKCKLGRQEFEIVLSAIAWRNMIDAIIAAVTEPHRPPPDPPEAREFLSPRRQNNRK